MKRIRREPQTQDFRALIHRESEKPFDSRIAETIFYEELDADGYVVAFTSEGAVYDNDGSLIPLSQVEGLVAIMDPGENMNDILQPKKQAKRKRRMRYLDFVGKAISIARG